MDRIDNAGDVLDAQRQRSDDRAIRVYDMERYMTRRTGMKKMAAEPRVLAFADQMLVSGGNFLSLLLLGRHLAAEHFGSFSLAMTSLVFVANLHRAVFTQPMNILGASESLPSVTGRMLALLRAQALAIPVAVLLLAAFSMVFFPHAALLFGGTCYIAGLYLQEMSRRYWYTVHRVERAVVSDLISYGGQLVVLAVLASAGSLDGAAALIAMGAASLAAFLFDLWRMKLPSANHASAVRSIFIQHWALSRWLLLSVPAVWGASQLFPFLLAALGPAAVATYVACRNLLNATSIVVQSVGNYLPVRAAALLRRNGKIALRRHLMRTLAQAASAGMLFVVLIVLTAGPLMHLAYGGLYDGAASLLRKLALATLFSLLGAVLGAYSLAMEDSRASFLANLGATCVALAAGIWLIHAHGLQGAAIAVTLSTATSMMLQGALVWMRLHKLPEPGAPHA